MPTYHYRCKNCGYDFTEQQSFSDAPITVCPQCGQERVYKVYAAPSIEFKGSGFYRTDNRDSKSSSTAAAPAKSESSSSSSDSSSSSSSSNSSSSTKSAAPAAAASS